MALAMACLSACSFMHEDLPVCEQAVRVHLKYDYNTQQADMFSDHAGALRVFVIDDATNSIVRDTIVSNRDHKNAILHHPESQTYYVEFRDLPMDATYRFAAYAMQRPYDETQRTGSDHFTGIFPQVKDDIRTWKMDLTYASTPDAEGRYAVHAPNGGLDTLWMGHTDKPLYVPVVQNRHSFINDTISMVRDTKYLQILLHQTDEPANIYADQYEVEIVASNAHLDWNNDVLSSPNLLYTPHFSRTIENVGKNEQDQEIVLARTPIYELSFSRLMYYMGTEFGRNARLRLIRKATGDSPRQVIADLNLPSALAEGRSMYAWLNYGTQEYLDREYNYRLDFYILGGKVQDILLVSMNITPWTIRLQDVEF